MDAITRLSSIKINETARVISVVADCQGAERRRLLDLGILPGTLIYAEMVSPSGDPTAYRIRGALIGLRKEQAQLIEVVRQPAHNASVAKHVIDHAITAKGEEA